MNGLKNRSRYQGSTAICREKLCEEVKRSFTKRSNDSCDDYVNCMIQRGLVLLLSTDYSPVT